tara:strand:+ start:4920 stop:10181 length:5262 start_codon:yes stop_codon:yes gene_type:complete
MPNFELNFNQNDYNIITEVDSAGNAVTSSDAPFASTQGDYIRLTILDQNNSPIITEDGRGGIYYSQVDSDPFPIQVPGNVDNQNILLEEGSGDFEIYWNSSGDGDGDDTTGNYYLKLNEILNDKEIAQGNYNIQLDFLNQYQHSNYDKFIVKQISPSRLEVRLKLLSTTLNETTQLDFSSWNNPSGQYDFKHVLYTGRESIPIVNYTIDKSTEGLDNQSLILKLYRPIPGNVTSLQVVTIEKEVLTTQTENLYYFSEVAPSMGAGSLLKDDSFTDFVFDDVSANPQNYNELTGSLSLESIENIITGSLYDYPNLNTNFNKFENHTFFGSAKRKLENFKNKVETIQSYYSQISSSFNAVSSSLSGSAQATISHRINLFDKIAKEKRTFTPYEKFLYYDGQSQTTASAPGLGQNYADTVPVTNRENDNYQLLTNFDGFHAVHKHSNIATNNNFVDLFTDKYHVHKKPFFNYSGSIYLSFLLKGTTGITLNHKNSNDTSNNGFDEGTLYPVDAFHKKALLSPTITGSEYRRFIFQVSQSYFVPTANAPTPFDMGSVNDFSAGSDQISILSGSFKTGSHTIFDSSGKYPTTVVTQSGVPFSGSIMPGGELFRIHYSSGSGHKTSLITDVKVSFKDPTDVVPFDILYHTSSANWTNWYDGMYDSASAFDTDNIHSLENNLPSYIQQSSEYDDLKDFLSLIGENFDLIRNSIDGLGTLHNRSYNSLDSVPSNLLPILVDNLGWDPIQPFSSSLSNYFGDSLSDVTNVKTITENTWRKTLNNLIYLYKSKGTENSVRALLNIYGYPGDVLQISEFGGSTQPQNDVPISPSTPLIGTTTNDTNLQEARDNVSFSEKSHRLYYYKFGTDRNRVLSSNWWRNNADIETLEFVYKHQNTTNPQSLFLSSGSAAQTLWDLRLVPSSTGVSSSFEFRLNNSPNGSGSIVSNAVSMSTEYLRVSDGQLWNVMLQRMSSSISGSGTNKYQLAAALQNKNRISKLAFTSMSVSGGLTIDSNYRANQNWQSTGSRHPLSQSNLIIGKSMTGSLAEIRGWSTPLSMSKFRLHTLNKISTVGNTINAHNTELVYHYKLNENYISSSISSSNQLINIIDSNPNGPSSNPTDHTFKISGSVATGSMLYGYDIIKIYKMGLQSVDINSRNSNKVIIKPNKTMFANLSPDKSSTISLFRENNKKKRINSTKLEINRSPQDFINNFIIDKLQGYNLETLYGSPVNFYSSSYSELNVFREDFFRNYEISVDINKFIRSHENIFNKSLSDGVKKLVPARSSLSDKDSSIGVTIKPTILEKQRVEYKKHSVETNPNLVSDTIEVTTRNDYKSGFSISETYEKPVTGSILVKNSITEQFSYDATKNASISINNSITKEGEYDETKNATLLISDDYITKEFSYDENKIGTVSLISLDPSSTKTDNYITQNASYEKSNEISLSVTDNISETGESFTPKTGSISVENLITKEASYDQPKSSSVSVNITTDISYEQPKSSSLSINNFIVQEASYEETKNGLFSIPDDYITKEVIYDKPKSGSFSMIPSYQTEILTPISGTNDYLATNNYSKFVDLHKSWGTSSSDVHFLNMATEDEHTSSFGDYNVNHIDRRYHFYMIGDVETYSGSIGHFSNFTDQKRFYNRQIVSEFTHKNITYNSYMNGNPGPQKGRAMGTTRYFYTSSDGAITLPSNHISHYRDNFVTQMYNGTQNTNPGIQYSKTHVDFSTASFYGVKVTGGETQLIVRTGDPNDTESPSRIGKNTLRFK